MKNHLINFLLMVAAIVLFRYLWLIGVLFTLVYAIRLGSWDKVLGYYSSSALSVALSIDLLGNVVCRDLLNWACIKGPDRYDFGGYRETISSVLGKNKASGSLTRVGGWLADLLNFIDPGHVERAAQFDSFTSNPS